MSRSHINVLEVGTVKEKIGGDGLSIPSVIVSDLTMGTTQSVKTNNLRKADGDYITLYNSMVQPSGFIASPNLTTDNLNENTADQGIDVTCDLKIEAEKKLMTNTIVPIDGDRIIFNNVDDDYLKVKGSVETTFDIECGHSLFTDTIENNSEPHISLNSPLYQIDGGGNNINTPELLTAFLTEREEGEGIVCQSDLLVDNGKKVVTNKIKNRTGAEIMLDASYVKVTDNLKVDNIMNTAATTSDPITVLSQLIANEGLSVSTGKNTLLNGNVYLPNMALKSDDEATKELVYNASDGKIIARPNYIHNQKHMIEEFEYTQCTIIENLVLTLPPVPTDFLSFVQWLIPTNYISSETYGLLSSNYPWRTRSNFLNAINVATLNGGQNSGLYLHIPSANGDGTINFCMFRPFGAYKGNNDGGFKVTFKIAHGTATNGKIVWGLCGNDQNPFECTGDVILTYFSSALFFLYDPVGRGNSNIWLLHRKYSVSQTSTYYDTGVNFVPDLFTCSIIWDYDNPTLKFTIKRGVTTTTVLINSFDANPLTYTSFSPIISFQRPSGTLKDLWIRQIKCDAVFD